MKGYTTSARLGIQALRPAPVIVNWLGYPGTLGHERLADYIIGDPIVTPAHAAAFYTERLALMPNCYQPNDLCRPLPPAPSRFEVGLPDAGLILCSFNQTGKLNPQTFDLWARLLRDLPDSLLWLLRQKSSFAEANVLREFTSRGVERHRVYFAPFAPQAGHIARLRLCDIALDTFPYNSHTTASDALWAGVPLVAKRGETFAGRVAESLLTAHGFPELVAENDEAYFQLAFELATDPVRLAGLKERLGRARMHSSLFDTKRFARDLEALYEAIVANNNLAIEVRPRIVSVS